MNQVLDLLQVHFCDGIPGLYPIPNTRKVDDRGGMTTQLAVDVGSEAAERLKKWLQHRARDVVAGRYEPDPSMPEDLVALLRKVARRL